MTWLQKLALVFLALVASCALLAPVIAPYPYDQQFRENPGAGPTREFRLGTDDVGRDRLSRLVYATRVSVILAPAAAFVSILLALGFSVLAGGSRALGYAVSGVTTVCLSLPWLFLFIILRAELPLNTGPLPSVLLTFALMGVAGFAWPARVFTASIQQMAGSGWLLQARASGLARRRIATVHFWPHMRSLAIAQFRILVPAYILSEASLGLLGLGVADPLPSWGSLLQDLQHPDLVRTNPWILAPLVLLMLVMISLEMLQPSRETAL